LSIPQSVWEGEFLLFGVPIRCHVLSDGQRVIEEASIIALLETMGEEQPNQNLVDDALNDFIKWMRGLDAAAK